MRTLHKLASLRSFTLVELLVVMGIIAVLAGVLMSAIPAAIRSAHFAASTSNVRQIGAAINTYAGDNDGQLPVWYDYNVNQYWWQTLTPYLGGSAGNYNVGVYRDPGDTHFDGSSSDSISLTISYGYNYMVMGRSNQSSDPYPARKLVSMTQASTTLALSDGPDQNCYGYIDFYGHGPDTNRYTNKTPALFVDGHVETLTIGTNFLNQAPYFNRN